MRRDGRHGPGSLLAAAIPALVPLCVLVACSSSGEDAETPTPSGPSGALGVVTRQAANAVVQGLCVMRSTYANDLEQANAVYYERVNDDLRVIVAAAEIRDQSVVAVLLQARERVKRDLTSLQAPEGFADDVGALLSATRDALEVIGLPTPGCA
ncbi:MAG: hypothetical protein AB1551_03135 [Actinomycetota bacterium]